MQPLAAAIGCSLAIFSVAYGLLVRPLPVADEERVVIVYGVDTQFDSRPCDPPSPKPAEAATSA